MDRNEYDYQVRTDQGYAGANGMSMPNNNDLFSAGPVRQPKAQKSTSNHNTKSTAGFAMMQHPMTQGLGMDRHAEQYNYSIPS